MADVFISYSRKDNDFVRRVHGALAARNRDVWVDWEDIPLSANWWNEIQEGIEQADNFVFVITPDSLESPICHFEIAHAVATGKRIIPVMRRMVKEEAMFAALRGRVLDQGTRDILGKRNLLDIARESWSVLARHNWLFFENDEQFDDLFGRLLTILDADLEHTRQHTRLLNRALEWEEHQRNASFLLTGDELDAAENWLSSAMGKSPEATRLHQEYLMSSRRQQTMGQRKLLIGVSIALIVAIGLSILSSFLFATTETQRGQLDRAYQTAVALADEADTLLQAVITNPPSILLVYDANSYVIVNRYPDTRLNVDEMAFSDGRNLVQIDDSTRLDFGECVQFVTSDQPDDSALERVCRTRNAWYSVADAFWLGSGQFQVGTASGFRLGVCDQHSGGGRSFCFIEVSVGGDDD